ncbi:MAG: hypothetical protein GF418_06505 [Chitinivibrionales bacterium]|nr:hypothetical protein [Chitinivibrionales bacterium]MBD3395261.1 hypothetical protein [Chitinivibrionales bacterium]
MARRPIPIDKTMIAKAARSPEKHFVKTYYVRSDRGTINGNRRRDLGSHVPVVERDGTTTRVTVGAVPHPMGRDHRIDWIELLAGGKVYRHDFDEQEKKAEAVFDIDDHEVIATAYCNRQGSWSCRKWFSEP